MNLRHDPSRWGFPPPNQPPEWQPHLPGGPGLPGWLEERLFDQRIVMLRGQLTNEAATGIAAALLTLDSAGPEPVQLHVASPGGDLSAALSVIDVIDALTAPVHALVTSEAGGAVLAVLAAADRRAAYRHARFKLAEPRAGGVTGTADEVAAAAGQHLRELEEAVLRLAEVTGKPRSRIEDDLSSGRSLSAAEALEYGLIDEVVAPKGR
ncbi:ATP-dependent Clp protease proteolytic subunit [Actinoplanes aureus]|uniref:ATP-dependent Clp protease proteolytic subunit n=1 Tax=Actinoplanes aureus TaxID=2792083 RepID=A0A931C537_9ACTN|nr:ATP-dependent Clp protease proteolytic subunit [Actinoplanes aureus]MBG0563559.1 ATP-dependent Clp protease proteolytic subunit [Actinoplanes aureus]